MNGFSFSKTVTNKAELNRYENYLKSIGAVKIMDDGFNAKWSKDEITYILARAF